MNTTTRILTTIAAAAAVTLAAACDTPTPPAPAGPSEAWLAACVDDWRAIYAADGIEWPGDAQMRYECREEWRLRQQ